MSIVSGIKIFISKDSTDSHGLTSRQTGHFTPLKEEEEEEEEGEGEEFNRRTSLLRHGEQKQ